MDGSLKPAAVFVRRTESRGLGVFAGRAYAPGDLIEVCPVIVMDSEESRHLDQTELFNYYFAWGEREEGVAIALGYGSLYNHSYHPNADHIPDYAHNQIRVYAYRPIGEGEEITINYAGRPGCRDPVWFSVHEGGSTTRN
ncbi:MAG: SET domain-containing protein [Methanomicrobiaceae archaeon]|uniref:SET domain-containing protein n=1 Tax=hydrocarbon metagenome TaxID=938273 RepID=A0A0W8FFS6_9ZZZZ|nr:SET domain-containing protein [Methanomicrobiaceae archaeon]MDD5418895.1 SET domain-containing protein [Methanomicrobiaceae archaeon]